MDCVKIGPMKTLLLLVVSGVVSFASSSAKAEYDFMQPYIAKKENLKTLPEKKIQPTLFCSNMKTFVDEARTAPRTRIGLKADRIVVSKTRRKLYLFNQKELIAEYPVAFGFAALEGPKSQMSDGRTPEGLYRIEAKNPNSNYHMALKISYPNDQDTEFAKKNKVKPGGLIMIHGFPVKEVDGLDPDLIPQIHPRVDWTQGCMAVTSDEIEEIYNYVDEDVAVEICPLEKPAPAMIESIIPDAEEVLPIRDTNLDLTPGGL